MISDNEGGGMSQFLIFYDKGGGWVGRFQSFADIISVQEGPGNHYCRICAACISEVIMLLEIGS